MKQELVFDESHIKPDKYAGEMVTFNEKGDVLVVVKFYEAPTRCYGMLDFGGRAKSTSWVSKQDPNYLYNLIYALQWNLGLRLGNRQKDVNSLVIQLTEELYKGVINLYHAKP